MRVFKDADELAAAKGEVLGTGEWHEITQEAVNLFADATGDHQWIHVDVEKADAGPFGGPIAHGYMTLSLVPVLVRDIYQIENVAMVVNYGSNKVRFPSPVRVGARVRATSQLLDVTDVQGGKQAITKVTVEIEGSGKPACVAEIVSRIVR
ncbi:MaoC family dehydratase [Kibdelosporangium phytohabitans]|uniref:Dehydratase n=1 Tax=Kibdelosporangium phytohabitans TaxID=860235 RepID=A0A0N9I374_9PSEU|nr:MaoC family dehydratase [Kibdelosporangium phytohabitans]ALG13155.1 dehydratase [Kibdelosporangium phytohabitans]MBE1464907.1 acyl dehydratase [Kibdelosporangium phytohabitans]